MHLLSLTNKINIQNFARRVYFAFWWRIQNLKSRFIKNSIKQNLVFTFGGRNDSWPTLGRDLYQRDPNFQKSIQNCNSILLKLGGEEILSYFESVDNSNFFKDESKFTCITAIQLSTTKIYNDLGFYPNAVLSISLGEPAAAYAAGAINIEDSLKISLTYMRMFKDNIEDNKYVFIQLNLDFKNALAICKNCPVWTEVVFENNPGAVLITCLKNDRALLEEFLLGKSLVFKLVSEKTSFPYHSSFVKKNYKNLKSIFKEVDYKPLKCDYYSPTLGKKIKRNLILDADYWATLPCVPVQFNKALQDVTQDGYKTFLQLGPPAISVKYYQTLISDDINVLDSYNSAFEELENQHSIVNQLSEIKFNESIFHLSDSDFFKQFRENFNAYDENSYESFEYLRKNGPIHFLPQNDAWLLLNYNDIDYALKESDFFSSAINKIYDPILLGAEPKSHKIIRDLLHPLFSPQVINELADFTLITADALLNDLFTQSEFDFVKDYSDPLSFLVLCNFFGLSTIDANRLITITGKDYHNPDYWKKLEDFFEQEFKTCKLTRNDCLWAKLRSLTETNQFPPADAVSLLKIVWTAGLATTSALISSSVNYILNENEIRDNINDDEKLISKFIEECLRLQPPLEAVYRITTKPIVIGNQQLEEHTKLLLHLKSGMADPTQYQNPEVFLINRPAKKHLAFGAGIHQCIGMGIARAEARSALYIVLKRFSEIKKYAHSEPEYIISDLKAISSLKLQMIK